MKKLICFLAILVLTACATTQNAQQSYVQACAAYGAGFSTALQLREQGELNPAQISAISGLDAQITPICSGPLPANPDAATVQITSAVTTLAATLAIQQEKK